MQLYKLHSINLSLYVFFKSIYLYLIFNHKITYLLVIVQFVKWLLHILKADICLSFRRNGKIHKEEEFVNPTSLGQGAVPTNNTMV